VSTRFGHVPLGSTIKAGWPRERRFLQENDAQPRLAAAGQSQADGVRWSVISGVQEHRIVAQRLAVRLDAASQVELALSWSNESTSVVPPIAAGQPGARRSLLLCYPLYPHRERCAHLCRPGERTMYLFAVIGSI